MCVRVHTPNIHVNASACVHTEHTHTRLHVCTRNTHLCVCTLSTHVHTCAHNTHAHTSTRVHTRTRTHVHTCAQGSPWERGPGLWETSFLRSPDACPYYCSVLKTQTYNKNVVSRYFSASPMTPTLPLPAPFAQMGTLREGVTREERAICRQNLRLALSPQRLSGQRRAGWLSWGPDPPTGGT